MKPVTKGHGCIEPCWRLALKAASSMRQAWRLTGERRVKTDRLDLERLMRELLALERGERSGVCRVVRVPSAEEEDAREQHRQRDFLVRQRTALVNRMSGLLMARGVRGLSPRRPDFLPKMQAALTGDGQSLRSPFRAWHRVPTRLPSTVARMISSRSSSRLICTSRCAGKGRPSALLRNG
jgi:transposase